MRSSSALSLWSCRAILSHDIENSVPARIERPFPEFPGRLATADREENHPGATHEIFERHITHAPLVGRNAAICRIVAVITHHKVISGRNFENLGVAVKSAVALNLDDCVLDAAW